MIGIGPELQRQYMTATATILKDLANFSDADLAQCAADPRLRPQLEKTRDTLAREYQPFYETFKQLEDQQLRIDLALAEGVRA